MINIKLLNQKFIRDNILSNDIVRIDNVCIGESKEYS